MGVGIMRIQRLYYITPFSGYKNSVAPEHGAKLALQQDPPERISADPAAGEIPAVVHQANITGTDMLPRPVKTGEFTVMGILVGNVVACIILDISKVQITSVSRLFTLRTDMNRKIH